MLEALQIAFILLVSVLAIFQLRAVVLYVVRPLLRPIESHQGSISSARPYVVVQVAAYREAPILPRLLEAIAALHWPEDRMEVQILDDSAGADAEATANVVRIFAARGLRIAYLNRNSRDGFKAGALNFGLTTASAADLIAYFDADCRPRPDFLDVLVPQMAAANVAAIQCRWDYPNARLSPLTMLQAAAFEYLFHYEFEFRRRLGLSIFYLGSAAIWKPKVIRDLGGWKQAPLTAEDVDMGNRAAARGWIVRYEPTVLADDDALESILAFRAQQRRWTFAVGRAAWDAIPALMKARHGALARLFDLTALFAHASIPLTLVIAILIALNVLAGASTDRSFAYAEWLFVVLFVASPSVLALVSAVRALHEKDWVERTRLLALAGPAAAATMTSFMFGLFDLLSSRRQEFVATPKAGQIATIGGNAQRWIRSLVAPVAFDAIATGLFATAALVAWSRADIAAGIAMSILAVVYCACVVQSGQAIARHRKTLQAGR